MVARKTKTPTCQRLGLTCKNAYALALGDEFERAANERQVDVQVAIFKEIAGGLTQVAQEGIAAGTFRAGGKRHGTHNELQARAIHAVAGLGEVAVRSDSDMTFGDELKGVLFGRFNIKLFGRRLEGRPFPNGPDQTARG